MEVNHVETTFGKESLSLALSKEPKQTWGGRGLVSQFPLSPALLLTADLDNLYRASQECRREINWKDSVLGFQANLMVNLVQIKKELLNGTYKIRKYKCFVIYEPKKRNIEATSHVDRISTRSLCENYLYPELTKHFIYDNGANQKGKGTDFTRKRFVCLLHRYWQTFRFHWLRGLCGRQIVLRFDTQRRRVERDSQTSARSVCPKILQDGNGRSFKPGWYGSRKRIVSTDGLDGP